MFLKKGQDSSKNSFESFPAIGGLMVSKMVADDKIKPLFMYREKRTRPKDSGWRIFTGFESEEYANDPNNSGIYNPSTILAIDPSIADILLKGVGSVYERRDDKSEWYKVTDFEMDDDFMISDTLTNGWLVDINNLFEISVEDGGVKFYTTGDKSVRISIRNEADKTKEALVSEYKTVTTTRDESVAITLNTFDLSDKNIARIGYQIQETDAGKTYNVIYGFSIISGEVVHAAFYFDEEDDFNWAIETWKSISLQ